MKPEHKAVLISERVKLVENLNIRDGLFSQLISRRLLNQRHVQRIQHNQPPDQQIEALLDLLAMRGEDAFDKFCEALKADFQEHVVDEILLPALESQSKTSAGPQRGPTVQEQTVTRAQSVHAECSNSPSVQEQSQPRCVQESSRAHCVQEFAGSHPQGDAGFYGRVASTQNPSATVQPASALPPPVAVQEEFHQQSYRRSIKPNGEERFLDPHRETGHGNPVRTESEARYLYQHILGEGARQSLPSSLAYSVLQQSQPFQRTDSKFNSTEPVYGKTVFEERRPEGYYSSPVKSSISSQQEHLTSQHLIHSPYKNMAVPPVREQSVSVPSREAQESTHVLHRRVPPEQVPSPRVIERDSMEIQRFIEIEHPGSLHHGLEHDMLSLPRHIEYIRPLGVSKGDHSSMHLLTRNDSVDTMHSIKRTLTDVQGSPAKRGCHDYQETVPDLVKPERLTTIQLYDKIENQVISIPVIDEPKVKPAAPAVVIDTAIHRSQAVPAIGPLDDPDMDLPDGPINVNVEHCTRQFYLSHYKQAYRMHHIPRGKALILNVNEVVGKAPRRGTDIDRDNLSHLLSQLHFDVTVYNDSDGLSAKEMVLKLQEFSQHADHQHADSTVICILSHGEEGFIFGSDGKKFELEAVFTLFDNTSCRKLVGKPKVFIIQACRGGALDKGVCYGEDEHDGSDARARQVPSMSDMIICYPTQNGYYAWRNRDRGSWYVEALVQVFMKYAKCEDMCAMLNRVNLLVSRKISHCTHVDMDQMSQMSEYKSTLRMPHLYFFPGIGSKGK